MGLFMFAHPTATGGRDTPVQVKSSEIVGVRGIRGPASQSLMALQDPGGSSSAWWTRSPRPIGRGEPSSNPMFSPPSRQLPAESFRGDGRAIPPPA